MMLTHVNQTLREIDGSTASSAACSTVDQRTSETATAPATQEDLIELENCRFNTLRNAIYHSLRSDKLEGWHRLLIFGIIASGTAGVAGFAEQYFGTKGWAAVTALLAALDFVMNLKDRAATHQRLKQRYYKLLSKIEASDQPPQGTVRRWKADLVEFTADEPRTFRALDAIAYNNAADALGCESKYRLCIPIWVGFVAHVYDFKSRTFETLCESSDQSAATIIP